MKPIIVIALLCLSGAAVAGPPASTCAWPVASVTDCGAICDAKTSSVLTGTSGSPTITCANCNFQAGDVGKRIYIVGVLANTTINARTNATTITVGANATATSSGWGAWYTQDDTAAVASAFTAVATTNTGWIGSGNSLVPAGTVSLPGGFCVVTGPIMAHTTNGPNPNFVGTSMLNSGIIMAPTYSGGDLMTFVGVGGKVSNLTISALGTLYTPGQAVFYVSSAQYFELESVQIRGMGATTGSLLGMLHISNSTHVTLRNVVVQDSVSGNNATAAVVSGSADVLIESSFFSNFKANMIFSSSGGAGPSDRSVVMVGTTVDECLDTAGCMQLRTSHVDMFGGTVYGLSGGPAIAVDGTSYLHATGVHAGRYNHTSVSDGITIASGGKVYSMGSTFWSNGSSGTFGKAVVNNGTFVDQLGNTYMRCTNNTCTTRTSIQEFSGHQPVRR